MQKLDGAAVSAHIKQNIAQSVLEFEQSHGRKPHLTVIIVGANPASQSYVRAKVKSCAEVGFGSTLIELPETVSEENLLLEIEKLNQDKNVDGILVQLPLPKHISEDKVILKIDPSKDVDGFHPINQGKMLVGQASMLPATPYGILLMLEHYGISTSGKHCVVIGRSNIVGTPISVLLSRNNKYGNATVTLCHSRTQNLKEHTLSADILVVAIGIPNFLKEDMVKPGAVIIDVGINRVDDQSKKSGFKLVGDVDYEACSDKASYMTPVPKGVGPMTICGLLMNTLTAAKARS